MKHIRYTIFLLFLLLITTSLQAQTEGYLIRFDLTSISKDRLHITVIPPTISEKSIDYVIPAVIPGSYSKKDFGRFLSKFKAINKRGKRLRVQKIGENVFRIQDAHKLHKIEYDVDDTWDSHLSNRIFPPGGTNLAAQSNAVINHHGYYGYFEGYKMRPYRLEIIRPMSFYGATALKQLSKDLAKDVFEAKNYVQLVDNPILYCKPDTVSFMAGNMRVHIAVLSESGVVKARQLQQIIQPLSDALADFFVTLPVEEYHFLFYFPQLRFGNEVLQDMAFGALEHSYSSFYFLPEYKEEERLADMVFGVAAHEFLHILTPLTIHSKEIEEFDFRNPKMSQHLWLYEGVTEYFSYLVMIRAKLIDAESFRQDWRSKVVEDQRFSPVSFTEMSQRIIEPKYQEMYPNVYAKGALIGFFLDLRLNELSGGKQNLKSVMMQLSSKYGATKPFEDDQLIEEIVAMTFPEIGDFFAKYVQGDTPLPYQEYFAKIGWDYLPSANVTVYSFGQPKLDFDPTLQLLFIDKIGKNNIFGLRANDKLVSIDGTVITKDNYQALLPKLLHPNTDTAMRLVYKRAGKLIDNTKSPKKTLERQQHLIRESDSLSPEQRELRAWLFGAHSFPSE